jgi:hypothetical protein
MTNKLNFDDFDPLPGGQGGGGPDFLPVARSWGPWDGKKGHATGRRDVPPARGRSPSAEICGKSDVLRARGRRGWGFYPPKFPTYGPTRGGRWLTRSCFLTRWCFRRKSSISFRRKRTRRFSLMWGRPRLTKSSRMLRLIFNKVIASCLVKYSL